jgi:hypothetical protein
MKYLRPYRPHGTIEGYIFEDEGHEYLICEQKLSNSRARFNTYTDFSRTTHNVFGNGSKNVDQSGWRTLPYDGPKHRRLVGWFEALRKNGRI